MRNPKHSGTATLAIALAITSMLVAATALATLQPTTPAQTATGSMTYSTNTTLTSNVYCTNLTVSPGVVLTTNGFGIFCSGTVSNSGVIQTGTINNGANAVGTCSVGQSGGNEPQSEGGSGGGAGSTGLGGCGGPGGAGGGTIAAGGAGGTSGNHPGSSGTTPSIPSLSNSLVASLCTSTGLAQLGGAGGGSGGGGISYAGEMGGNGGQGLCVEANEIITGTIDANGGNGANSPASSGGGGGGGGGAVILAFGPGGLTGGTVNNLGGSGGSSGGGPGGQGGNGLVMSYSYGTSPPIPVQNPTATSQTSGTTTTTSQDSGTTTSPVTTTITSTITSVTTTTLTVSAAESVGPGNQELVPVTYDPTGSCWGATGVVTCPLYVANVEGLTDISVNIQPGQCGLTCYINILFADSYGSTYLMGGGCIGSAWSGLGVSVGGVSESPPPDTSSLQCASSPGQDAGIFTVQEPDGFWLGVAGVGPGAVITITATTS